MGQFSWLDCRDGLTQILDNVYADVFVLVPKEFGGGRIRETYYDGYGNFGVHDIYELVADWNRKYLSENPDFVLPSRGCKVSDFPWYEAYANLSLSHEEIEDAMRAKNAETQANGESVIRLFPEYRCIGIDLACWDEDNASLPYPIKITHDPYAVYERENPSLSDPNQGWSYDDDDEDDEEWEEYDEYDDLSEEEDE